MTLRAGTQYRLDEGGRFLLDVGLKYGFSGPGDFFAESEHWFAPYAGVSLRR